MSEKTHTALHILKGAVQRTLGAEWTAGVFAEGEHGRLTVKFDRKPTDPEVGEIEQLANAKIAENVPVEVMDINRKDAESKFGKIIYDLFPLPENITQIRICSIEGWNINCCNKEHCKSTGEVGGIKISKVRFRDSKQLLEIGFDVI